MVGGPRRRPLALAHEGGEQREEGAVGAMLLAKSGPDPFDRLSVVVTEPVVRERAALERTADEEASVAAKDSTNPRVELALVEERRSEPEER